MTTPILGITEVANNQTDQYLTVNEALRDLESAGNAFVTVNFAAGDVTLTGAQFTRNVLFRSSGNTVSRRMTIPASMRLFIVENAGSVALIVKCGTTEISVDALGATLFYSGGTANGLRSISSGSSGGGGGGLVNWVETKSTAAPNATIPVVSFAPVDPASNVDAAIVPKGTGSFLLAAPDGLAAGGVKRGNRSVDLQLTRSSNDKVAAGANSFAAGIDCRVAGAISFAIGESSTVSGSSSYSVGKSNVISNNNSYVYGQSNTASVSSFIFGNGNTVSNSGGFALGQFCNVGATQGFALGYQSSVPTTSGKLAFSGGQFSAVGDAQSGDVILRASTATAAVTVLTSTGLAAAASSQLTLPNASAYVVKGMIVARQNATGDTASWKFECCIKRGANAAATALVAACTPVSIAADAGASAWAVSVTADTTNGALKVEVTGEASKNIRWVARLETAEVSG